MAIGPKTSTKYETRSGWEEEMAKELGHETLQDYYSSLLLSGAQKASDLSSTYYQQESQKAAEAASYDISKAYANYLKQQRNVAGAANLMAGHKEELSSALRSDYETAYSQARASESQSLATAANKAADIYSDVLKTESGKAEELLNRYQKEATIKANIYKLAEEKAGYNDSKYAFYTQGDNGLELTPWGQEQIRKYLLEEGSTFKSELEAAGMEDELAYYLSNPTALHKDLFGVEETLYSSTSDTAHKANVSILNTDFYDKSARSAMEKAGESGYAGYAGYYEDTFGLTKDEIRKIITNAGITGLSTNDVKNLSDDDLLRLAQGNDWERWHYELTKAAEKKHGYDYYTQRYKPTTTKGFGGR